MSLTAIAPIFGFRSALARMQWHRGLRAGLAVGVAMFVAQHMHGPTGWAALGALNVTTIDNGGPYRTRLNNMLAVILPSALGVLLGTLAGVNLPTAFAITFAFCFLFTLARVISQPMAAASVFILVAYIVAYGGSAHTLAAATGYTLYFLGGGLCAAALALLFWPLDPFGPARESVATLFDHLQQLTAALPATFTPEGHRQFNEQLAQNRTAIEAAHAAIAATPARMAVRTVRARNLSVLTESADLLLARILRIAELGAVSPASLAAIEVFLHNSLAPVALALRERPAHLNNAFRADGSLSMELHRSEPQLEAMLALDPTLTPDTRGHLIAAVRDALFNLEIIFEALQTLQTGAESPLARSKRATAGAAAATTSAMAATSLLWLDAIHAHLTLRSVMGRHALRLALVVSLDVLLMPLLHVTHGYWLAMTSLIVLRPFAGETVRRSAERVVGTVLGGILAALLTAVLPSETALFAVIVIGATCAIAIYTVDYAWYCFFLTPTIVLLTLPHLRDWHLAAVRTGLTGLGALIAVLAMLLLWPERESLQLPGLLARAAAANAAYLRAVLAFWKQSARPIHDDTSIAATPGLQLRARMDAERTLLAPARRLCGLAVNDAEDTLDHALLEHAIPLNPQRSRTAQLNSAALTFTTYLRRITGTATTLAAVGLGGNFDPSAIETLATRLDAIVTTLTKAPDIRLPYLPTLGGPARTTEPAADELTTAQLRRLDRQVSILEATAAEIASL
jgi:uncharacterized membrane protein YccC